MKSHTAFSNLTVLGFACLLSLSACGSAVKLQSDYDEAVDFSVYGTYAWIPEESSSALEEGLAGPIIRRSIEDELGAKSMIKVDSDPDLYVVYHAGVTEEITGASVDRYGYRYGRYYGGWGTADVSVQKYTKGTLVVDFVDAAQKELVWRGIATGAVNNPEKTRDKLPEIVADLLAEFPPAQ